MIGVFLHFALSVWQKSLTPAKINVAPKRLFRAIKITRGWKIILQQWLNGNNVPKPPKDPIKPGASAPIKVSFDSKGKPGAQEKTVTLTTNTENGHETFKIKANVTPMAGNSATTK